VKTERGIIAIDGYGRTNVKGLWAIGDVTPAPGWRTRPATKA
jgi:dihydrolipoamide dehydrogenase